MSNLEQMYYNLANTDEYYDFEHIAANCERKRTAMKEIENIVGRKAFMEVESIVNAVLSDNECAGFITGYGLCAGIRVAKAEVSA